MRNCFRWLLIVTMLLMSGSGNAHAVADHAAAEAMPCAAHQHHHPAKPAAGHQDCCCACIACPAGLVTPVEPDAPRRVAYDLGLAPALDSPLASRSPTPELDPPRPSALS